MAAKLQNEKKTS